MTRERKIKVLMEDGLTEQEAKRTVDRDMCVVYDDEFERNFFSYIREWSIDWDMIHELLGMIIYDKKCEDWSKVRYQGHTYYVEYFV